jgi:hypothetical protein
MMPMVPPPPVPVAIRAPVGLLDWPSEFGGRRGGNAGRRRGEARRYGADADAQTHQRRDDDCTHVILLASRGTLTERSHGLALATACCGPRSAHGAALNPSIGSCQIALYRDEQTPLAQM